MSFQIGYCVSANWLNVNVSAMYAAAVAALAKENPDHVCNVFREI